jgi:Uma2 family endonuclease
LNLQPIPNLTPAESSRLRRFTIAEYHAICKSGIFGEYEPTELLEGLLIRQHRPMTPRECFSKSALNRHDLQLNIPGWFITITVAIPLEDSEPEPDAAFVRGDFRDYEKRHPVGSEVGLVVEVADASLEFDRTLKQRIYARGGISNYWIVNVVDLQLEVYTDPLPNASPPAYASRTDYHAGQSVLVVLDGVEVSAIAVAELLP